MSDKYHKTRFIVDKKYEKRTKNTFYDDYYNQISDDQVRWRDFGALEKCQSIMELCNSLKLDKVVDVGAGTCSVLSRLDKLGFAPRFYAFEVSPSVIRFIREKVHIPKLKEVYLLDTSKTGFDNDFFDLGILSHVLEHVAQPIELLAETLRICRYVVVEVPLDDCLFVNMYERFAERMTGRRRSENPTGHINFFDKLGIHKLVRASGGVILKERTYRQLRVYPMKRRVATILQLLKSAVFHIVFGITDSRLVGSNHAMLTTRRRDYVKDPTYQLVC